MVKIHKDILDQKASNVPGRSMTPKYITVHNTANTNKGANAEMHARYQHNGSGGRQASWHYTVDDTEIYQTLKDNQQGWHAGDGRGKGNTQSIGIEICENSDGNFNKAVENAQWLIKKLMDKHDIPLDNVVTHKHWSGKNCPRKLLNTWSQFKAQIDVAEKTKEKPTKKPSKPKKKKGSNLKVDGKWGSATTKAAQKAIETVADGVISSQPRNSVTESLYGGVTFGTKGSPFVRALQRKVNAKVDGKLGPETVRQTQRYLGTPVDGIISRPSSVMVRELQRKLNAGTF